jgi:hypothetical protein
MNITLSHVILVTVFLEKEDVLHILSMCVCVCLCVCVIVAVDIHHARRTHHITLPSVTCPSLLYFSTQSHKTLSFLKESFVKHKMCVFIFPTTFLWNISHSKKKWARYCNKCGYIFKYSICYSYHILMKLEFSRQIFEKHLNIKFYENPSSGKQVFSCGQASGRSE